MGGQQGLGKGPKNGAGDSEHGAIRVDVHSHVQGATIPNKRVLYTVNICKCHACKKRDY
jgi:hypothetical protein